MQNIDRDCHVFNAGNRIVINYCKKGMRTAMKLSQLKTLRMSEPLEKNGMRMDTGFLGSPYLLDALCKIGRQDVAYQLLW